MPYLVTIKVGLADVVLPNGQRAQGGQIALLTDDQYAQLSPTANAALLSAVTVPAAGAVPATTVGTQAPNISGATINGVWTLNNPGTESDNEPSTTTTPLNTPYTRP